MEPKNEGGVASGRVRNEAVGRGVRIMAEAKILQASSVVIGAVVVASSAAVAAEEAITA